VGVEGRQEGEGRARYSVSVPFEALTLLAMIVCGFWLRAIMDCPDVFCGVALGCLAAGMILVTVAKVSLFRHGIWYSWGSRSMPRPFAICYRLGCAVGGGKTLGSRSRGEDGIRD
jgi:hypothetical protein